MSRSITLIGTTAVLIALAIGTMDLWSLSALAAASPSYQLTSDAQNQETKNTLRSTSYQMDVNAVTWRKQPLKSTSYAIVPVYSAIASSSFSSTSSSSGGTGGAGTSSSASSNSGGNRRPRPITPPQTPGTGQTPGHPAASSASSVAPQESPFSPSIPPLYYKEPYQYLPGNLIAEREQAGTGATETGLYHFFQAVVANCDTSALAGASMQNGLDYLPGVILLLAGMLLINLRKKKLKYKKHRSAYLLCIAILLLSLLRILTSDFVTFAHAAQTVPDRHVYNGHLLDGAGQPVTTPQSIRFSYWKAAGLVNGDISGVGDINTGALNYAGWQEVHTVTPNSSGFFSIELGSTTPLPDMASMPTATLLSLYLQVEVKPSSAPNTSFELLDTDPTDAAVDRSGVLSVPFALNADMLDQREVGSGSGNIALLGSGGTLSKSAIPAGTDQGTFTLDANNTETAEISLQFGSSLAKKLTYDIPSNVFKFNTGVQIQGNLTVSGLINGVDITALQNPSSAALKVSSGGGLQVNIAGGSYRLRGTTTDFAGDSILLPPSASSYLFFGSGGLTSLTTGFPTDESIIPLAEVLTSPGAVLSIADRRIMQTDDRERTVVQTFSPGYEKASYQGDGTDNIGQLAVSTDNISLKNFYAWTSTRPTLQDYDIILRVSLPPTFARWKTDGGNNPLSFSFRSTSDSVLNNKLDLQIYDTNGVPVSLSGATTNLTSLSWQTNQATFTGAPTWTAGQEFLIRFKLSAKDSCQMHLGTLKLNYIDLPKE